MAANSSGSISPFSCDPNMHELILRCTPFEGEKCETTTLDSKLILAWNSTRGMIIMDKSGTIHHKIDVPKKKSILALITLTCGPVILLNNGKVYRYSLESKKFENITYTKNKVLPVTFKEVCGGAVWATKNSVIFINGSTGNMDFKVKFHKTSHRDQVTAITSIGNEIIAVGTSSGHVICYDRLKGDLIAQHSVSDHPISCLIGGDSKSLAIETKEQVSVLTDIFSKEPDMQVEYSASLVPGTMMKNDNLLIKYNKTHAVQMSALYIRNIINRTSLPLYENKFWEDSHAEFSLDGKVIGGGGSDYRPFRVWDSTTGACESETLAVQASPKMKQTLNTILCQATEKGIGVVDLSKKHVTLFATPKNLISIDNFFQLSDQTIVAIGNDGGIYTYELN